MPCALMRCEAIRFSAVVPIRISPSSAGRKPNSTFSSVDFPVPFGPSTVRIWPRKTSTETPLRMLMPGRYPATTLRAVSTGASGPGIGTQHLLVVLHLRDAAVGDLGPARHHHHALHQALQRLQI